MHLFKPQRYFIQEGSVIFHRTKDRTVFTVSSSKNLTFPYTKGSWLPTSYGDVKNPNNTLMGYPSFSTSSRLDISKSQEELLFWHSIIRYYDIKHTQDLLGNGMLVPKETGFGKCIVPLCRSCVVGKSKQARYESTHHSPNPQLLDVSKKGDLKLGDQVSTN